MHLEIDQKDIKTIYNQLRNGAKKRDISFDLTLTDLNELTFPINCPVLGIRLCYNKGSAKDNSVSIDRIDSSKGYEIDNIVVVSNRVNKLKNNANLDELLKIAEFYTSLQPDQY